MIDFEYHVASSVDDAIRTAAGSGQRFVAGGTTIIDLMKLNVERPIALIDINGLSRGDAGLAMVSDLPTGGLRLGALARMSDVAWDARLRDRYPFVSQALLLAASGQLRNMATMGGNILQRTRCPYFRDTATPCNKRDPGSGCSALTGISRTHAILGTSEQCIATHPSDLAVALVALDATVRVRGPNGERLVSIGDFHLLPGQHPERETALSPGELITAIDLPPLSMARRSTYLKIRDRASFAFALASAAVALDLQGRTIRGARIALGGVATKPWRSKAAERALVGRIATPAAFRAASAVALADATPRPDNRFKVSLARHTLERALMEVSA